MMAQTNGWGILIAIKEKLKTIVVEVNREDEIGQTLWCYLTIRKKSQNGSDIWTPRKCNTK